MANHQICITGVNKRRSAEQWLRQEDAYSTYTARDEIRYNGFIFARIAFYKIVAVTSIINRHASICDESKMKLCGGYCRCRRQHDVSAGAILYVICRALSGKMIAHGIMADIIGTHEKWRRNHARHAEFEVLPPLAFLLVLEGDISCSAWNIGNSRLLLYTTISVIYHHLRRSAVVASKTPGEISA